MTRFIGRLSDDDLAREAVGVPGLTLADAIERGLIGHLQGHARAVRLAVMEGRALSPGTNSEAADPARLDEVRDENTGTGERLVDDEHETARGVGRALTDALGEDLVAVYLHGSAVLGGFRWERSDLDLLALSRTALSDEQFGRVVSALAPLHYPANGLEFTLMTAGEASQPEWPAPRFQLHLTTGGWRAMRNFVDGRLREGDRDLVLHLAVCREHGDAIVGPPPRSSLAAVPEEAIESAMRDEIDWAREHGPLEYLVLTSARAWLFFATRRIASKIDAGVWAAAHDAEPAVIEAALGRQRGAAAAIPTDAAERFAERVERLIRRP
jgi:streptomycin 3"-adenylyltransferase